MTRSTASRLTRRQWLRTMSALVLWPASATWGQAAKSKAPKAAKSKSSQPPVTTEEFAARIPAASVSNCDECGGLGRLPLKVYVHVEGQAAAKAADSVPHRYCPACQAGKNDMKPPAVRPHQTNSMDRPRQAKLARPAREGCFPRETSLA